MSSSRPRPVVLCIFDGFGARSDKKDNAIALARTPNLDRFMASCPHSLLDASEEQVGLPHGQMGNSEVGHMNLGAGRIIFQDLPMIDRAIAAGELAKNPALLKFIDKLKAGKGSCHLMGLLSPGGVHAHQNHIIELARIISEAGVPVLLHAFLDGRDVLPQTAKGFIAEVEDKISGFKNARIATLCGRYYAMDRDKRWDRVEKAYRLLITGEGKAAPGALQAIDESYAAKVTDEFVLPVALPGYNGMNDGDGVLMANFRADRAREILLALLDPAFNGFARAKTVKFAAALGMVEYSDQINKLMATMFPPKNIEQTLGEVVSKAGLKQLRIAETEKYAHVTFFLNGGREEPYAGEERILVPSPQVATYDLKPEMSAGEVTDKLVAAIEAKTFDLIVVNYANGDMVGHTGILPAAIKAVETLDTCLGRLESAVKKTGGVIFLTADHGNCETMSDEATHGPHTAHTLNLVPALLINGPQVKLQNGKLCDVAPTLLQLMQLPQPAAMTGKSLIA
ncbi:MAG TPA: 2,3-bisphosphoglycerate-independent phosphoglycerate mutase [Alphaproteobacteria bacterium]|nr:2,3-bisphosphoglycerate-independent phosphoglycerate mutase [Alphaproteobacteria bacterium]